MSYSIWTEACAETRLYAAECFGSNLVGWVGGMAAASSSRVSNNAHRDLRESPGEQVSRLSGVDSTITSGVFEVVRNVGKEVDISELARALQIDKSELEAVLSGRDVFADTVNRLPVSASSLRHSIAPSAFKAWKIQYGERVDHTCKIECNSAPDGITEASFDYTGLASMLQYVRIRPEILIKRMRAMWLPKRDNSARRDLWLRTLDVAVAMRWGAARTSATLIYMSCCLETVIDELRAVMKAFYIGFVTPLSALETAQVINLNCLAGRAIWPLKKTFAEEVADKFSRPRDHQAYSSGAWSIAAHHNSVSADIHMCCSASPAPDELQLMNIERYSEARPLIVSNGHAGSGISAADLNLVGYLRMNASDKL
eukprot:5501514-Amphidinium_carterae.1